MDLDGKIVTFYSFKGGTGRSMALANVAWVLATAGKRVLAIDWDLEAPGLHRYFQPFLTDPHLESSTGVIDFVLDFATTAVSYANDTRSREWYMPYANLLAHAQPVAWEFPEPGLLDFVPAGRQDAAYAARVNSFDWRAFYEQLGGGVLLELVREQLRKRYDYILIDSRTGVSDTSGICTVQMPDELVVCFTLNQQSLRGAAAVAASAFAQRRSPEGQPTLIVWPVPMRVEYAEQKRLEIMRAVARTRFSSLLVHLDPEAEDRYWGEIEVNYQPFYAYEEVLAAFGDRPRQSRSMLTTVETIARYLAGPAATSLSFAPLGEDERLKTLARFTSRPASALLDELRMMGQEYETIRRRLPPSGQRTFLMTALVTRAQLAAGKQDAGRVAEQLFKTSEEGARVIALALARSDPQRGHIELALNAISTSRSAFEQYHGLMLAEKLVQLLDPTARLQLHAAISRQVGTSITDDDRSRADTARALLDLLKPSARGTTWTAETSEPVTLRVQSRTTVLVWIRPVSSTVQYDDVAEDHGPWLVSRGHHTIHLPRAYRLGQHLVTNELFSEFIRAGGYSTEELWLGKPTYLARLLTADGRTRGPATWPTASSWPEGKDRHPVSGISFVEADAFAKWCNRVCPTPGWRWDVPTEDMWEYAARTEARLIYPWGDVFDPMKCQSREGDASGTAEVGSRAAGASRDGCHDIAGNVWEFVRATETDGYTCVLKGGSFRNDRFELRTYLRLFNVNRIHRPDDFGMRLAQFETDSQFPTTST